MLTMQPMENFLLKIMSSSRNNSWLALFLLFVGLLFLGSCNAQTPNQRNQSMNTEYDRVRAEGHLAPCPNTPNCVNSEQRLGKASIAPLQLYGSPEISWQNLQHAVQEEGGQIESVSDTFLYATFRSRIFRFVDDVTCRLDPENKMIHIRSASRIGYSDLGANRRRVEKIRSAYKSLFNMSEHGP